MELLSTPASRLHCCSWICEDKIRGRQPNGFYRFPQGLHRAPRRLVSNSKELRYQGNSFESNHASFNKEALILKQKSEDIVLQLNGRSIYLVGMMGSGKTTVGKILSEVLEGYSFIDTDRLVEQAVGGGASVTQIFIENGEDTFREKKSEALQGLSIMRRLVVATGGGAVIRKENWEYMKHGVTVWLDVPLESLAKRISIVGINSRPLLRCQESSGNAYVDALKELTDIFGKRSRKYANANARVCIEHIASKLGLVDVSHLTATAIATDALIQIENFVKEKEDGNKATPRNS
ncbi:Shikimate kinase protein [Thalictrum thalictroides]|uniref:Shikimate kinase protein n=1 Tax=Thalictrum thalictroides TaxID=46969 RepID=A0A7J6WAZ5_THATH|nr:Shikimate kinase protein [Thalictrum thalictroides]